MKGPGVSYILLVIPTLLALTVLVQGINKLRRKDKGGATILGFGIAFVLLVVGVYFFVMN